jgi:hypothetical protein
MKSIEEVDVIGGLVASAVLVDLTISQWVGRKTDRAATRKVVSDNNAKTDKAAHVTKNLFVGNPKLEEIARSAARSRAYVDMHALPWIGNLKLLPMARFVEFQRDMAALQDEFYQSVEDFLKDYDVQVAAMAFKLGSLFNRAEYPTAGELRGKFNMEWNVMPLPSSGDFRVEAEANLKANLREAYQDAMNKRIEESMKMLWGRLKACLEHMLDRLGESEDGKPNVFRNSMLENANELLGLLKDMNIGQDPELERARKALHAVINQVEADELRSNHDVRTDVRQHVQDILDRFQVQA